MSRLLSNPGVMSLENLERQQRMESASPVAAAARSPGQQQQQQQVLPRMPETAKSAGELESDLRNR